MQNIAEQLLSRFLAIRHEKGEKIDIGDAAMIISDITDILEKNNTENENNIYTEIRDISEKIQQVKKEIAENLPNGVVPEATQELDAVVKSTEDATNRILDAAEKIRDIIPRLTDATASKAIEDQIIAIFEACNFQDITGQRIKKVTSTLQYIENSVTNIMASFDSKHATTDPKVEKSIGEMTDKDLMNGPQLETKAPSQDDVDRLFDSA